MTPDAKSSPPEEAPTSHRKRLTEKAQRNPVAVAAMVGTLGIGGVTTLIEVLKTMHVVGGSGIVWQVSALVIGVLWMTATYAGWMGRMNAQRAESRASEATRIREIYQEASERAEKREERTLEVIGDAITELKNGQAQLGKAQADVLRTVGDLARTVGDLAA